MKIVKPSFHILTPVSEIQSSLGRIERVGRICYKSENKITATSYEKFVKMLIDRGHEAMIEHGVAISVLFTCDRGISHELVRHRVASFAQESTRYCNYGGTGVTFIEPYFFIQGSEQYSLWHRSCELAESMYQALLDTGATPQEARTVLPNSTKTEIVVTANIREWRHMFILRTAATAHPQMRELMRPLLKRMKQLVPILFDDIETWKEGE